jgi:hypothetical protein
MWRGGEETPAGRKAALRANNEVEMSLSALPTAVKVDTSNGLKLAASQVHPVQKRNTLHGYIV